MAKILVVDDDRVILQLITYNLESDGHSVIQAHDGEQGFRCFLEHNPDLVLLDVMMPIMDGYEVCKKIKAMGNTPVIMLSARAREEDILKGYQHGADDYMKKPFNLQDFLWRVHKVLDPLEQSFVV